MEYLTYLLPVVAIVGVLVYSQVARKSAMARAAAGHSGQMFHDSQAPMFPGLAANERLVAVWHGVACSQPRSAAGAILNAVAAGTLGVSTYVPNVLVGLTTAGRVLVSEEYSELGSRGNYKIVATLPAGARATSGRAALPPEAGSPPKNPFNPMQMLDGAAIYAPDGSLAYLAWLSPTALACAQLARPIGEVLPFGPEQGAQIWAFVNPAAPTL